MDGSKNISTDTQAYLASVKRVNRLYIFTLAFCGTVVLGAIAWAVLGSVFVGLLLGICSIIIYMAVTANLLYRSFGISYKGSNGRLLITQLYGRGRKEIWIPERIIMLSVTAIGDGAFNHRSSASIEAVHLPATLEEIGENVFMGCESLKVIYFYGSRDAWEKIEKHTDLSSYEMVFPTEATEACGEARVDDADNIDDANTVERVDLEENR